MLCTWSRAKECNEPPARPPQFRIVRSPGCINDVEIGSTQNSGLGSWNGGDALLAEWQASGACIIRELPSESDFTIRATEHFYSSKNGSDWTLLDHYRRVTRVAISDRSGVVMQRTMVETVRLDYGHSKGAEYAELAATRLSWIDAVVACVPTDVVWQGYGIGDGRNRPNLKAKVPALYSSFSWRGRPLPYVPLEGDRKPFHSNPDFYDAKRRQTGTAAIATEIPVERSRASFLFLGGGRDEVWSSGFMAKRLDARMKRAGKATNSEFVVYERAGHAICGEGGDPTRVRQNDSPDPRDPDLDANGRATVDA